MPTKSPFVTDDNLSLTVRNASVEATMSAADEETPEPAGMLLVKSASIPMGASFDPAGKYFSKTPCERLAGNAVRRGPSNRSLNIPL